MAKDEKWTVNNKKWENMPDVMLSYRAASFFSRAYCPDLTGGFHSSDELSDADIKTEISANIPSSTETIQAQILPEPVKGTEENDATPSAEKSLSKL